MASAQQALQAVIEQIQTLNGEMSAQVKQREQLQTQQSENSMVKKELDLVKEGEVVYKLVGPALLKQDLDEAKTNVAKRLEYIEKELTRYDGLIKTTEDKLEKAQSEAMKLKTVIEAQSAQ
eukprot:m.202787 g.202787  ORF g.202787 m.202787 type:complete len:121 (-) comp14980_c0_seq2:2493-2855(-)